MAIATQEAIEEPKQSTSASQGYVVGAVRATLRLEGLVIFGLSLFLYAKGGGSWGRFAALFLVPDVSFAGYLFGVRAGALAYNTMHSYLGPVVLGVAASAWSLPVALGIALIWGAHVGLDRAFGYGLKYRSGFRDTHLGPLGRRGLPVRIGELPFHLGGPDGAHGKRPAQKGRAARKDQEGA